MKKTKISKPNQPRTVRRSYPITESVADSLRFSEAISGWNREREREIAEGKPHIGMLGEKSLHSIVKHYLVPDTEAYETRITSKSGADTHRYVADIATDGRIYEIQTGGFYPLIPKISYYLTETDYDVTIVHPIPFIRYKVWIDPETGEIESRKKSPKKGRAEDALREIFWLRSFIGNSRFHVKLLFLEEDEYRYLDGWSYDKKRGSNRCERVPAALVGSVDLYSKEDYGAFLREELPEEFTAGELGAMLGLRGKAVYSALKVFLEIGLASAVGHRGRSVLYRKSDGGDTDLEETREAETAFDLSSIEAEDLTE